MVQRRALAIWSAVTITPALLALVTGWEWPAQLALGLTLPGVTLAWPMAAVSLIALCFAFVLWLGTGNVLAPLAIWLGAAALGMGNDALARVAVPLAVLPTLGLAFHLALVRPRIVTIQQAQPIQPRHARPDKLAPNDLPRLRLLLDRALQPIGQFKGFDHLDQFQTAALRYQVNFISYALAMVQARYLPAYEGHYAEAQRRLLAKLGEPVVWSYWKAEAAWGQLRLNANPVGRDNIMYSGFAALQMGLTDARVLRLNGKVGDEIYRYDASDLANALSAQYQVAPLGLVACEPGWIYPLCNAITASGLAALDARSRSAHWPQIRDRFARHLVADFTATGPRFLPVRSALTGVALPPFGGVVADAMTALFLNATLPQLALEHWQGVKKRLDRRTWTRDLWPLDAGNYQLGRGASIAGTAAAAAEFGDLDLRDELLDWLDQRHPEVGLGQASHRPGMSLWAHAVEAIARSGDTGLLSDLVNVPRAAGPRVLSANWPEVEPLSANLDGGHLRFTLFSSVRCDAKVMVGYLRAGQTCQISGRTYQADHAGQLNLTLSVAGETSFELEILP